jgi:DNA primase
MRFMCEATCLQGYNKIPKEGNNLIITKSYKDVMTLYNFGIAAVAPQAESQIINEEQYIDFSKRFKNVYSMYDFDLTGIRSANKMRKLYNIQPLFLTNGRFNSFNYGSKDPSDFVEKEGPQEFIKTINRFKNFKP